MLVPKIDLRLMDEKIKVHADTKKAKKKQMVVLIWEFKVGDFASNERLRKPPTELRLWCSQFQNLRLMVTPQLKFKVNGAVNFKI